MSYQPLARRYRPQCFAQVVGQATACKALLNALRQSKVAPAVIFTGIRGTGKTTLARILAKALNCDNSEAEDACSRCDSCSAVAAGIHEDVLEIDGASHTGVEDVRELQESLSLHPQRSTYRVYIIDEVHMLSISAFNALLKTLEEPKKNTVFIFATTELAKIPVTIRSRCQIFYLQKLTVGEIAKFIGKILQNERIIYDVEAVNTLATQADGSMRDALTMLDQVILLGDNKVDHSALQHVSSYLAPTLLLDLLAALVKKNSQAMYAVLQRIAGSWLDYIRVVEGLAGYARHAFILKELADAQLSLPVATRARLLAIAKNSNDLALNRIFRSLIMCRKELDGSSLDRYVFENYCFEWCLDPGFPRQSSVSVEAESAVETSDTSTAVEKEAAAGGKDITCRFPATWQALLTAWRKAQPLRARQVEDAKVEVYTDALIKLSVNTNSSASVLLKESERKEFGALLTKLFGFAGELQIVKSNERRVSLSPVPAQSITAEKQNSGRNNPLIKKILDEFGGEITDVYTDT